MRRGKEDATYMCGRSEGSLNPGVLRVDLLRGRWLSVHKLTDDWP